MSRKPIENIDYFVYMIDLPGNMGGYVTPNPDGTFSVYLNRRLNRERNIKTLLHEEAHIVNGDFAKYDVAQIEGL